MFSQRMTYFNPLKCTPKNLLKCTIKNLFRIGIPDSDQISKILKSKRKVKKLTFSNSYFYKRSKRMEFMLYVQRLITYVKIFVLYFYVSCAFYTFRKFKFVINYLPSINY